MTAPRSAKPIVVAAIVIGILATGTVLAGSGVIAFLASIGADTAAVVTALVLSALVVAGAVRRAGWAEGPGRLRAERKAEAYAQALGLLKVAGAGHTGLRVAASWDRALTDIALWGSTGVVRKLAELATSGISNDADYRSMLDAVLREMRQDLGQVNLSFRQGQLADFVLAAGADGREPAPEREG